MPTLNERQDLAKKSDLLTKQDTLIPGTNITIAPDGKTISAAGGGSTVTVTPVLSTGTRVAAIEVDGTIYTLFAPTPPSVGITQIVDQGVELARVTINGVATSIYAPESSTVLSGTSAPTAAQGEDNNLYVQYVDNSGTLSVVATYVKLSGSWVELAAGGGSSVIPNPQGTSVGVLNSISIDGDKYSIHPENWEVTEQYIRGKYDPLNEFGWYAADQTYYIDSKISWTVCSNNFTKTNDKPALGAAFMLNNGNYYTMLISTDSSAVAFTGDKTTNTLSTTIDGVTWYYSYTNRAIYTWAGVSGITYAGSTGTVSDTVNYIIQQSQISTDHPYRNKIVQMSPPAATGYLFGGGGLQNDLSDATFKVTAAGDIIGNAFHGATTLANGTVGLVPAPLITDKNKFLKGDGTWAEGGGGNANQEELTYDEYEALSEAEKTNGTVYYITDADAIQPDKFRPVIYSENEREIGVWTDGKPLYQKTAFVTPGNTISTVGLSLKHAQCYSISTSGGITPVPYNDGSYICWWMSSDAIRFATQHSDISQYVITYQYTKDSDFAGSGKWTPQGVPAHHYSTDERIIGTWVDGSTLYERTYTGISQTGYSDTTIVDADIKSNSGIYNVKSITGLWTIGGFGYSDATIQAFGETGIFNGGSQTLYARVTPNGLAVVRTNTNFGYGAFLTVRYTKTTS